MTESTDKQLLDEATADEQQLDEYLKGDSSVSRQYRQLPGAEVPAELDRLVLRQAADAVNTRSTPRPAWMRWTAPLAVAASAVLVLSIVIETGLRDETARVVSEVHVPVPTQKAEHLPENERAEKAEETFASEQAAPAPAPAPPPVEVQSDRQLSRALPRAEPKVEQPRPTIRSRAAAPPAPAPAAAPRITAAESVSRSADIATETLRAAAAEQAAQQQSAHIADEIRVEQRHPAPAVRAHSRSISAEISTAPQPYSDPEAWLEDIRQLRKDNKQAEADREWRRFRVAFPDYQVAETDLAREAKQ